LDEDMPVGEAKAMGWNGLVDGGGKSRSLRVDNKSAKAKASAKATADPCGMTTKRQGQRQER
jgi:hypothetical protein